MMYLYFRRQNWVRKTLQLRRTHSPIAAFEFRWLQLISMYDLLVSDDTDRLNHAARDDVD